MLCKHLKQRTQQQQQQWRQRQQQVAWSVRTSVGRERKETGGCGHFHAPLLAQVNVAGKHPMLLRDVLAPCSMTRCPPAHKPFTLAAIA
jgi:hypothetical protein